MSTVVIFLSLLTPLVLGFLLLSVLWPNTRPFVTDFALRCCLSVGVGFGVSSCLVFLWMKLMGQLTPMYFSCELLLTVALGTVFVCRTICAPSAPVVPPNDILASPSRKPYWLQLAVCIAGMSAIVQFVGMSLKNPDGLYDALGGWNLRARFLYSSGSNWTQFRFMEWSHPDYPLLISASIARCWKLVGRESQIIPIAIAFLFTFAAILLVLFSLSRLRGQRQGLLATLILLGTPFLIAHGASQYADVPVSYFFVATVVSFLLYAESPTQPKFLVLAGLTCGLAAWTKNEGSLFAGAVFFAHAVATTAVKGKVRARNEMVPWLAGIAPVLAVVAFYKTSVAVPNDVISAYGLFANAHKLLDASRYLLITQGIAKELLTFGSWSRIFPVPVLLLCYFSLLGSTAEKKYVIESAMAFSLTIIMIGGYFFVYLVTPFDLSWHLHHSLNRLLLQVWPMAVVAFFLLVRTPEEA